jgi:serine/threonine-protein kinase HipA
MICLSVLVRNGDAHLKNFGILYDRDRSDRALAPVYDMVTTTAYVFKDRPALTFGGRKYWPGRRQLIDFGVASCGLKATETSMIYDECRRAVGETRDEISSFIAANPGFADIGKMMLAAWTGALDGEPKKDGFYEIR